MRKSAFYARLTSHVSPSAPLPKKLVVSRSSWAVRNVKQEKHNNNNNNDNQGIRSVKQKLIS